MRAWRQADMNFIAVSDVAASDLDDFITHLRAATN
jgi:hypothetical protein